MKVILTNDIEGVGKIRQIVDVKTGYANNYLFKNHLAVPATDENMEKLNKELELIAQNQAQLRAQAEIIKNKIDKKTVVLKAKSGPEGRFYGAVTSSDVADAINRTFRIDIDKRKVECPNIKVAGVYEAKVKLYPKIEADVKIDVQSEQ